MTRRVRCDVCRGRGSVSTVVGLYSGIDADHVIEFTHPCSWCIKGWAHETETETETKESSMTPTPEQLADVLPRVAAGIDGGNWTKESGRLAWATKVLKYVETALHGPESDANPVSVPVAPENNTQPYRDPNDIRDGDTWEVRNGRAVVTASNDWPPPQKGTHESDLFGDLHSLDIDDNPVTGRFVDSDAWEAARIWSRTPDHPPMPTGRDDQR